MKKSSEKDFLVGQNILLIFRWEFSIWVGQIHSQNWVGIFYLGGAWLFGWGSEPWSELWDWARCRSYKSWNPMAWEKIWSRILKKSYPERKHCNQNTAWEGGTYPYSKIIEVNPPGSLSQPHTRIDFKNYRIRKGICIQKSSLSLCVGGRVCACVCVHLSFRESGKGWLVRSSGTAAFLSHDFFAKVIPVSNQNLLCLNIVCLCLAF